MPVCGPKSPESIGLLDRPEHRRPVLGSVSIYGGETSGKEGGAVDILPDC